MRDRAHWLALVSQSHRLGRERVCEGQPTCERFRVGHEQRVHELAIPQMPTERNILSIFLQVGLLIGLTGTILGNVFGIGLSWAANHYRLVPLPRDIYFVNYLPFHLDIADVIGVNVIAVALSVIATWYPARIASRLDPISAIREE